MALMSGVIMGINTHEIQKPDKGDKADTPTSVINLCVGGLFFILGFYVIMYMGGGAKAVANGMLKPMGMGVHDVTPGPGIYA